MKISRREFMWLAGAGTAATVIGCATNPYTGEQQLMLVSREEAAQMGLQARNEVLKKQNVTKDPRYTGPVISAGTRITSLSGLPNYDWEFNVIKDDTLNAFALPGGYTFIYTGLWELANGSEAELAAVIGHEIAHIIARHGSERMSLGMASQLGKQLAATALGGGSQMSNLFMVAYDVGASVGVILPYSREHELEADEIGTKLMARAGYDPRNALKFWKKMAAQKDGGGGQPAFLSTHPATNARINHLESLMPEAMELYRQARRG